MYGERREDDAQKKEGTRLCLSGSRNGASQISPEHAEKSTEIPSLTFFSNLTASLIHSNSTLRDGYNSHQQSVIKSDSVCLSDRIRKASATDSESGGLPVSVGK